ncbi:MAG TPA: cytochrome P450, partial [Myxococcota bacterium]|nr:cytochrome P450 [Myxococcota bacterium]
TVAQEDPEIARGRAPDAARLEGSLGMQRYCLEQALARRARPGSDVLSVMGAAQLDGRALPARTIAFNGTLLIVAGFETTRNALAGGVLELIRAPEQMRRLRQQPELIPSAVEEIVRWTSPLTNAMRTATRDTQLGGRRIREGECVAVWLPSCNRDEQVFRDADRFDVARAPNDHIGFGYGRHYCLGAHLARLELRLMLAEIAARLPELELAGEIERVRTNTLAGIKHMPVRFPAAAAQARA